MLTLSRLKEERYKRYRKIQNVVNPSIKKGINNGVLNDSEKVGPIKLISMPGNNFPIISLKSLHTAQSLVKVPVTEKLRCAVEANKSKFEK